MIRILLLSVLALSSFYSFGQTLFKITLQPVDTPVCTNKTISLSIQTDGNSTRYYQWQRSTTSTFASFTTLTNSGGYTGAVVTNSGSNENIVTYLTINTATTGAIAGAFYRCRIIDGTSAPIYSNVVSVTIVAPPPAPTTTNGFACSSPSSVLLSASGATGTQTYQWYFGGKPINGETASDFLTPAISTNTTYYVTIDNGVCESAQVAALAQLFTPPAAPTVANGSACGASAVVLTASGGTNGQYRWYTQAGKTPIAGQTNATYTTPVIAATTTYNVSIFNGTCESSRVAITATINTIPAVPTTTGNSSCSSAALLLTAAGGGTGQYRWYTTATGGTAIAGQTNNNYTTPLLTTTTTYYVAVNNGFCESARASVVAQINTVTPPVTTGSSSCGAAALTLTATGGSNSQYRWYTAPTAQTPIAGQTNATFTTPVISATTSYYVSINNGTCESVRTIVTATINTPPAAPVAVNNSLCSNGSVLLGATGAKDGNYRWYTGSTGGQAIASEVNGQFLTPPVSTTTIYYAAINNGTCESARTPVTATIGGTGCNNAPVIQAVPITTQIEGKVTLDLVALISDADKNLDLNTLKVVVQPASGASASITASHALILDYSNTPFSGVEYLTIEVCDLAGACSQKQLSIEVAGDIIVYNAISPGNDGKNDIFLIKYIDILNNTQKNHVYIYSRWGDVIFDIADYNNTTKVFRGLNNSGNDIPSGTYFYKVEFANGKEPKTGYITLKR